MKISGLSVVLVGVQMLLIMLIVITGNWYPASIVWIIAFCIGWLIAIAAALAFRLSTITVFPEPKEKATLISHGIYGYIRHPLYTAVLLVTGALVGDEFIWWRLILWGVLLIVLLTKIKYEEKLLEATFEEYSSYKKKTKKLIPFIW